MNDTPARLPLTRLSLILLVLALAIIWFGPLGLRHLVPSDEGRYAEMAREMFVTGDWITPRYNGYKYFEKPPLQTWANALTFAWFGIGEWQARLYTALTGFAGVLLLGYTGTRVFNAVTGFTAAVVLATCPYWNLMGHFNTLDMALSFWMELTFCALLLAQRPGLPTREVRLWMWLCWAGMGAAVLSKGLVGLILPGAVLVLYSLIARDWALWKRLYIGSGLIVFLIVVAPWFVLVQMKNPEFFNFFFIVQQFQRYLTPAQNRPGPFYYFVPVLIVGFLYFADCTDYRAGDRTVSAVADEAAVPHASDRLRGVSDRGGVRRDFHRTSRQCEYAQRAVSRVSGLGVCGSRGGVRGDAVRDLAEPAQCARGRGGTGRGVAAARHHRRDGT
jgi:4-amino-4-deoxy-L-arabinose transferase-like glycosyltransferase